MTLPDDAQARKAIPLFAGFFQYFPSAIVAVAALSAKGNVQHGNGDDLYWDRSKSSDEGDALLRHQLQVGTVDTDGVLHSVKVAWRAMAQAQKELEALGAPVAPGARNVLAPVDPRHAAYADLHDEFAPTAGLKAGEAHEHDHAAYVAATASLTPEGS